MPKSTFATGDATLSTLARGLVGSEILKIAGEARDRRKSAAGQPGSTMHNLRGTKRDKGSNRQSAH
jgi:hypothetical protein